MKDKIIAVSKYMYLMPSIIKSHAYYSTITNLYLQVENKWIC